MRLRLSFLLLLLIAQAALAVEGRAQTPAPSCPSVTVESKVRNPPWAFHGRDDTGCVGAPMTFTAAVTGIGPKEKYTFHWTVSEGKIVDGQGTSSITVATEEAGGEVTATVELVGLRGLKTDCNKTAQASVSLNNCDPPCPTLSIACPTMSEPGVPATVSVNVSGGYYPDVELKYNWVLSAGVIASGQGTPTITIDTTGLAGGNVAVKVEVEGLPPECDRTESCTFQIPFGCVLNRLFDQFGDLSENEERTRLDTFSVALQNEPTANAYVIVSGGGDSANTRARLDRIKNYLSGVRGIDPARIETVDGGGSKFVIDLFIRPHGALPPQPTPNF